MEPNQTTPEQVAQGITPRPKRVPPGVYTTIKFVDIDISVQLGVGVYKLPRPTNARAFAFVTHDPLLRGTSAARDKFIARVAFECDPGAPLEEFQLVTVAADVAAERLSKGAAQLVLLDIVDHPKDHRPIGIYLVVAMSEDERASIGEAVKRAWAELAAEEAQPQ